MLFISLLYAEEKITSQVLPWTKQQLQWPAFHDCLRKIGWPSGNHRCFLSVALVGMRPHHSAFAVDFFVLCLRVLALVTSAARMCIRCYLCAFRHFCPHTVCSPLLMHHILLLLWKWELPLKVQMQNTMLLVVLNRCKPKCRSHAHSTDADVLILSQSSVFYMDLVFWCFTYCSFCSL